MEGRSPEEDQRCFLGNRGGAAGEPGVQVIQEALKQNWSNAHNAATLSQVQMRLFIQQFGEVLRQAKMALTPGEEGRTHPLDRLIDGLLTLFYLTLIATVFDIERSLQQQAPGGEQPTRGRQQIRLVT